MQLPAPTRRKPEEDKFIKLWIYGAPFTGKTTLANKFESPLMLNTDGNIKFVDAPYIAIKDQVKRIGRATSKTSAWEVFNEAIDELEKNQDIGFKTKKVDLL